MTKRDSSCRLEVADAGIRLSNGLVSLFFDTRLGLIMLTESDEKTMCFSRGYVQVHTDAGVFDSRKMVYRGISTLDFHDGRDEGKAVVLKLQDPAATVDMHIKLVVVKDRPGYSCVVQFKNNTGHELKMTSIETLLIDVDDGSRVYTGWSGESLRFFKNGFHSWELTQATQVASGENTSHFFSVLNNPDTGAALVMGFATLANQFSTVSVFGRQTQENRLARVACTCQCDNVSLPDKHSMMSEEMLLVATHEPLRGLRTYVDVTSHRMRAVTWKNVPTGWCSWYFYYTMPDQDEIVANSEFVQRRFADSVEWIQLDDGFQKTVGDWECNSRFSSGLKNLADRIRNTGHRAGIWTAPFVATEHSVLFKDRPDWFVRDEDGNPIAVDQNVLWLGNYYALDLTNPAVLSHIEELFKSLKADGYEYFKIDFLHHAVKPGIRQDMNVTRAEALRLGLETVRKAVGEDLILGCGAPLGPCVGITNAMRIGTDIASVWRYETMGLGVYECAINTMSRSVLNGRWWINDPDCVLVRQDDTQLTMDEVRLWVSLVALSGGLVLLSDRMMDVSEERLRLLDRILPPYGKGAFALDALVRPEPSMFVLPIETPLGLWAVAAAVNLTDKPIDVTFPLGDMGLDPTKLHYVFDFWKQEYLGLSEKTVVIKGLNPHSCKLLAVKPETKVPTVLSTTMHFTQGAVELNGMSWDSSRHELSTTIAVNTRDSEAVFFVYGSNWRPEKALVDGVDAKLEQVAPEVVAVRQVFKTGQIVKVRFRGR
ncbi:MAG: hypothetical protein C4K49_09365 [Candidatus Thorarchaeota archaeon]|nr:MAG: hypothetical protein C4K49_09365 [Candidatus Thorarchaeota archaeon]